MIVLDTIFIDASFTSLEGEWLLKDSRLYFIDQALVGVKVFDLDGLYIEKHIERGRGPNEILKPMLAASFSDRGDFVAIDRGWIISLFNECFKKDKSYILFGDIDGDAQMWDNLLRSPDRSNLGCMNFLLRHEVFVF